MNLEFEFTLSAKIKAPIDIGVGPFGTRSFFEVSGGAIEGKKLNGKILSGGGDWTLIGTDGFARLDVRVQLLTDDGASLYLSTFYEPFPGFPPFRRWRSVSAAAKTASRIL